MKRKVLRKAAALILAAAVLTVIGAAAFAADSTAVGRLWIQLYDSDGGGAMTAPGAVYELYVYKGSSHEQWQDFSCEELYGEYESDENGIVSAEGLPAGEYRWIMTQAPEGWNVYNFPSYYFPVSPGSDGSTYAYCYKSSCPEEFRPERIAYIGGYPDGTVRPKDNISRAETAVILHRLLSDEIKAEYGSRECGFRDVKDGAWYEEAVATLTKLGVIVQNGPDFEPSRPITRGEFAEWIYFFGGQNFVGGVEFNDEPNPAFTVIRERWQKYKIVAMHGWVQGYPEGDFRPEGNITRAEMMTIINRMMDRVPASAEELPADMKIWSDNANPEAWFYLNVQEATNGIPLN